MDTGKYLAKWLTDFLTSRNAVFRTLESIDKHDEYDLHIKHKTKEQFAICRQYLEDDILARLSNSLVIVCFNTKENFDFLVNNWEKFVEFPGLTIYFINPSSPVETKWIINPHVHNRICDTASLKQGLKTMFQSVESLTEDQIKKMVSA